MKCKQSCYNVEMNENKEGHKPHIQTLNTNVNVEEDDTDHGRLKIGRTKGSIDALLIHELTQITNTMCQSLVHLYVCTTANIKETVEDYTDDGQNETDNDKNEIGGKAQFCQQQLRTQSDPTSSNKSRHEINKSLIDRMVKMAKLLYGGRKRIDNDQHINSRQAHNLLYGCNVGTVAKVNKIGPSTDWISSSELGHYSENIMDIFLDKEDIRGLLFQFRIQLSYRTKKSNGNNSDKDSGDNTYVFLRRCYVSVRRYLYERDINHSIADFDVNREYQGEHNVINTDSRNQGGYNNMCSINTPSFGIESILLVDNGEYDHTMTILLQELDEDEDNVEGRIEKIKKLTGWYREKITSNSRHVMLTKVWYR